MRTGVLGVAVMAVLAGCGAQTQRIITSFTLCNAPGHVLIRQVEPEAHGAGVSREWCVEAANAYHVVSLGLRCPTSTRLKIDFQRHRAECAQNTMGPPISITLHTRTLHTRRICPPGFKTTTVGTRVECSAISKLK
jgi:hypothetical protein